MPQKTIVISCVPPRLTDRQAAGMLELIRDLQSRGYRVCFYGPDEHTSLKQYKIKKLRYSKLIYRYYYYKTLWLMPRKLWQARLVKNFALPDASGGYDFLRAQLKQVLRYLCTVKPYAFLCWNPNSATYGLFNVAAGFMGIKTAAIEWGQLPETYILDKGTLAASAVFNCELTYADPDELLQQGEQIFNQLADGSLSTHAQVVKKLPDELLTEEAVHTRVLLLGIDLIDSGTYPVNDPDSRGLLPFHTTSFLQAQALAEADPDFKVIFKPHPVHNIHPADEQVLPNLWIINSNPDQLIEWADVVVCTGSKMELSVLLKNKPLITIGAGLLYNKGCTYEVRRPEQLHEKVMEAKRYGVNPLQLISFKQFLGYLKAHYLYVYNSPAQDNSPVIDRLLEGMGAPAKITRPAARPSDDI